MHLYEIYIHPTKTMVQVIFSCFSETQKTLSALYLVKFFGVLSPYQANHKRGNQNLALIMWVVPEFELTGSKVPVYSTVHHPSESLPALCFPFVLWHSFARSLLPQNVPDLWKTPPLALCLQPPANG